MGFVCLRESAPYGHQKGTMQIITSPRLAALAIIALASSAMAQNRWSPVDFSAFFNSSVRDFGYCAPFYPSGPQNFNGVPFTLPSSGVDTWNSNLGVTVMDLAVNVPAPLRLHTLINTLWGQGGPTSYASIELYGSGGAYYRKDLVGNSDIRDYAANNWTNQINNTTTINAFTSTMCSGIWVRLDQQILDLPAAFLNQRLVRIVFTDSGAGTFQRIFVHGITVETGCPEITQQPVNGSRCISGIVPFSIEAAGSNLTYQWQIETAPGIWATMGGDPLPLPCGGFVAAIPAGAPSIDVSITPCADQNRYRIRCIVGNFCNTITSQPATLFIKTQDLNDDGAADQGDIDYLINLIAGGGNPTGIDPDLNSDGSIDQGDVDALINWIAGGECP